MSRRHYYEDEEQEDFEQDFSNTKQEKEDVRVAPGIPTLYEIRKHIMEHAWNGGDCLPAMSNYQVFSGQCEYASTAVSEILTGTGKGFGGGDWSLRIRGWYCGDFSYMSEFGDTKQFPQGLAHAHSWVKYNGKIYDPTFWQFTGDEVCMYEFNEDDPRFIPDPNA